MNSKRCKPISSGSARYLNLYLKAVDGTLYSRISYTTADEAKSAVNPDANYVGTVSLTSKIEVV